MRIYGRKVYLTEYLEIGMSLKSMLIILLIIQSHSLKTLTLCIYKNLYDKVGRRLRYVPCFEGVYKQLK